MSLGRWLYGNLKIVVIHINPSTIIIYKNDPRTINTRSNIFYISKKKIVWAIISIINILITE